MSTTTVKAEKVPFVDYEEGELTYEQAELIGRKQLMMMLMGDGPENKRDVLLVLSVKRNRYQRLMDDAKLVKQAHDSLVRLAQSDGMRDDFADVALIETKGRKAKGTSTESDDSDDESAE